MERDKIFFGVLFALIIFLSVTLFLGVAGDDQPMSGNWSISLGNGTTGLRENMYVGPDGTFYTVAGASIYAIGSDGKMKWTLPVRDDWIGNLSSIQLYEADSRDGTLFVVVGPEDSENDLERTLLLAVAKNGQLQWRTPVEGLYNMHMELAGNRIYLYYYPIRFSGDYISDYTETIAAYDLRGALQWKREDAYNLFATGPDGVIYLINQSSVYADNPYTSLTSTVLYAYYPNGTLYWGRSFGDMGINKSRLSDTSPFIRGILYHDGAVYVLGFGDVIAVGEDGSLQWVRACPPWTDLIGFGDDGRLYVRRCNYGNNTEVSIVITPGGNVSSAVLEGIAPMNCSLRAAASGIGYYITEYWPGETSEPERMSNFTVKASDLKSGRLLWSYTLSPIIVRTATLNTSNAADILMPYDVSEVEHTNWIAPWVWYDSKGLPYGWRSLKNEMITELAVSDSTTYFGYWAYSYDYPGFYGMSNCTYSGGLYAIDREGKLLWSRETDSYITAMTARNGTVYYQVNGGRFGAAGADLTAGFAAAVVYLFFRFFLLGAVSRARARLDKNANRNTVLAFIAENPGASLYEITRALTMNVGTVRYHLLILSINHRVSAAGNGQKSTGYFTCSRLYSDEEKLLMPLLRRDQIRELLCILSSQPGLSNAEIAAKTGLAESAVSRYMIELNRRGVVARKRMENGKQAYCIEERFQTALPGRLSGDSISFNDRQPLQEMSLAKASR